MDVYEQAESARTLLSETDENERFYNFATWSEKNRAALTEKFPDIKIMGIGTESLVIESPSSEDQVWVMGYDRRKKYGILPFAENHNIQKILRLLYPHDFVKVFQISGVGLKSSVKEKIGGVKLSDSEAIEAINRSNEIEGELLSAGVDVTIDSAASNYLKDRNRLVNIDYIDGYAGAIKKINIEKVLDILEKNTGHLESEEKNRQRKELMSCIVRLQELWVANQIFQNMVEKNEFDIDEEIIKQELGDKGVEQSIPRIKLLLTKAAEAVQKKGYKYNKRWLEI